VSAASILILKFLFCFLINENLKSGAKCVWSEVVPVTLGTTLQLTKWQWRIPSILLGGINLTKF